MGHPRTGNPTRIILVNEVFPDLADHIGASGWENRVERIELSTDCSIYLLEKGKETSVSLQFL